MALVVMLASCAESKLKAAVEQAGKELPMKAEEGIIITDISLEGDYVVYGAKVDENLYSIDLLEENKAELKKSMMGELDSSDEDVKEMLKLCKEANKGISYIFTGDQTGETCEVRINPSELR